MIVHILRHGRTFANENSLYCGSTDLALSPRGIAEIESYRDQGVYPEADVFFTSGLLRAQQTARLIYGNAEITSIPDLNEYDFGVFEMNSYNELMKRDDFREWIADETELVKCPDGESRQAFNKRVTTGYESVLSGFTLSMDCRILIVCHGGVIVRIMDVLFPNTHNYPEWQPEPGRGYTITYTPEGVASYVLC